MLLSLLLKSSIFFKVVVADPLEASGSISIRLPWLNFFFGSLAPRFRSFAWKAS